MNVSMTSVGQRGICSCVAFSLFVVLVLPQSFLFGQTAPFFPFSDSFHRPTPDSTGPVTWEIGDRTEGSFEFSGSDLVITGDDVSVQVTDGSNVLVALDLVAESQVLLDGPPDMFAGLFSRSPNASEAYGSGILGNGTIFAGIRRGGVPDIATLPTSLSPTQHDVIIRSETFGNTLTISA